MYGPDTAVLKVQPPLLQKCSIDLMWRSPLFPLLCFMGDITQVTIPTEYRNPQLIFLTIAKGISFQKWKSPKSGSISYRINSLEKTHFNQKNDSVQDSIRNKCSDFHDTWNTFKIHLNFKPKPKYCTWTQVTPVTHHNTLHSSFKPSRSVSVVISSASFLLMMYMQLYVWGIQENQAYLYILDCRSGELEMWLSSYSGVLWSHVYLLIGIQFEIWQKKM